ncbi:MAG TPA: hypothetical protein PLO90_03345 [Clostridia bacterium]|nr:hypothetical protein [Clostridia bacterium]HQA98566.1 hypothetical protein [Clostridia bacterium]HQO55882.1 hypothetical protein [Clostridia bacterium]HUM60146.1 hypothetical protein [Clostridia bacterium]
MDDRQLERLIFTQRPVPGPAFDLRISRQAQRLAGETQVMKKKISVLAIVVATVLSLALCGAVAELLGINLFELFGREDQRLAQLAPKAALNEVSPITMNDPKLGAGAAGINSAYYDGQSLVVAYAIRNGRYLEEFTPTQEQLAGMEQNNNPLAMALTNPETDDLIRQWNEATAAGKPFGFAEYTISPSDHTRTPEGLDLPPDSTSQLPGEDGQVFTVREYVSPLPEEARDLDVLHIEIGLFQTTHYHYFDGQQAYSRFERVDLEPMKATVWRTDAHIRRFEGQGSFAGVPFTVTVTASAAAAQVSLKAGDGVFPALPEDAWYAVHLRDGKLAEFRSLDGTSGGKDTLVFNFHGTGQAPDKLELQLRVDAEDGAELERPLKEPVFVTLTKTTP